MVAVEQSGNRYICRCSYEERAIPREAGFRWDAALKCWFTKDAAIAEKLMDPEKAAREHKERQAALRARIEASRAANLDVDIPVPDGLAYLPYQRAGIATAMQIVRDGIGVLLADEMGLGKTIQAIGIINADPSIERVLVICPASLRLNWQREFGKWLTRRMQTYIVQGSGTPYNFPITIINYDILAKHVDWLQSQSWDMVIVDEAHYLKSKGAKRSRAVFGIDAYTAKREKIEPTPGIQARHKVALTGTPIPNRTVEGFGLFHWLAPKEFANFFSYAKRYCAGNQNGYGWDFTGSSNLQELQDKLRGSMMIRRLKMDVLTELPAKRRHVVEFPANGAGDAVSDENEAWARNEETVRELRVKVELAKAGSKEEYESTVRALRDAANVAFTEMSRLRHATALQTVPYVIEHILNVLGDEGHKVVIMAHHQDVIAAIMSALAEEGIRAVKLTGSTEMKDRQAAVDEFQNSPDCRAFVGNIIAAGVGITLTAAAHVIFAELDWVPGNMTQAEDRCHRIGQRDSVIVQHCVLEGSLSARMAQRLIEKQEVIDRALDRKEEISPVEPEQASLSIAGDRERAATETVSHDKLGEIAATLTDAQMVAIHTGLKMLAASDQDHASSLNGIGFSKVDGAIGHSLAGAFRLTPRQAALGLRLVTKYRRQLSEELVSAAKAENC